MVPGGHRGGKSGSHSTQDPSPRHDPGIGLLVSNPEFIFGRPFKGREDRADGSGEVRCR
jgi:hypothetical protein